jgi:hypothetical protein
LFLPQVERGVEGAERKEAGGLFEEYGQRLGFEGDGVLVGVGIAAGEQREFQQAVDE